MKKMIATGIVAASLALSPVTSAPASAADAEDLIGLAIGLAAIAALAHEVDKKRDRKRATRHVYDPKPVIRKHPKRHRARVLPEACLRNFETRRGYRAFLGTRCLERNGVRTARLPDQCERYVQTWRGERPVFAARCLRRQGFAIR